MPKILSRHAAFRHFFFIEKYARPSTSFYRRFLTSLQKVVYNAKKYEDHGYGSRFDAPSYTRTNKATVKKYFVRFFVENEENILTAKGSDLDLMCDHFGIDENLPTQQKQEAVYEKFADIAQSSKEWTKAEVVRQKRNFLKQLETSHFPNIVCHTLGIKESVYKGWLRSDLEFSEAVRQTQQRFGERIALNLMQKAEEGDLGAQMYALKQFEGVVKYTDPAAMGQEVSADMDISRLSPKEQEELLRLMDKARTGADTSDMKFLEDDADLLDASGNAIDKDAVAGLLTKGDEPRVFDEDDDSDKVIDVTPTKSQEVIYEEGD